ncbi:hypothetical protein F0562_019772 [Nyssa sinensis]|uniref:Uncharacterized protein n=1 Tax=Nyssa sinensis TaxID=561372 RepID=A0A5J5BUQ9_9ASTE|nr:hypothetical protein F0562_019772 [Nyssa sinensis]
MSLVVTFGMLGYQSTIVLFWVIWLKRLAEAVAGLGDVEAAGLGDAGVAGSRLAKARGSDSTLNGMVIAADAEPVGVLKVIVEGDCLSVIPAVKKAINMSTLGWGG